MRRRRRRHRLDHDTHTKLFIIFVMCSSSDSCGGSVWCGVSVCVVRCSILRIVLNGSMWVAHIPNTHTQSHTYTHTLVSRVRSTYRGADTPVIYRRLVCHMCVCGTVCLRRIVFSIRVRIAVHNNEKTRSNTCILWNKMHMHISAHTLLHDTR